VNTIAFSDLPDVHIVTSPVTNRATDILPEELASQNGTTSKRVNEFTSGRYAAHAALARAGLPRTPILRNADRTPVWPPDCKGSISHSTQLAAAAVTSDTAVAGLGLDIETTQATAPLKERLQQRLFTADERRSFAALKNALDHPEVLAFSAKEAVYKAIYPIAELMIGFTEVAIHFDPHQSKFTAAYLPTPDSTTTRNMPLNSGQGYFQMIEGHVLTLFVIPQA